MRFALAGGYVADLAFGDPERLHPVAGFGRVASATERAVYAPNRWRGGAFTLGLVAGAAAAGRPFGRGWLAATALTWAALGGRSLVGHASRIADRLEQGDLDGARATLPALVGRDPLGLDEAGVSRAVVESLAENTADAVVGTLFWGSVAGAPGIAAYRAANTLDAMVGHRSERYLDFGWSAARLDDAMSWPVARLGALLTVACAPIAGGSADGAWRAFRRDGASHPSPNAGRMEAAFAGALGARLGGPLSYGGRSEQRPYLGDGGPAGVATIRQAMRLSLAVGAAAAVICAGAAR